MAKFWIFVNGEILILVNGLIALNSGYFAEKKETGIIKR